MITILLAAYNGAAYISQQIDSLLGQTVGFDTLYIQDDRSTDNTRGILSEYQKRDPARIKIAENKKNTGNPKHNFYSMMGAVRDDYVMLCDQDDVWLPDKIEKTLAKMREMEREYGKDTPLLVHTDLCVADKDLNTIIPSFRVAMNVDYNRVKLKDQIIQNTLTGCTAMYNRALAERIGGRRPDYMLMHDWWLMLVASAFGRIGRVDGQTILYRQHGGNEIGARDVRSLRYKIKRMMDQKGIKKALADTYRQAGSFLAYYRADLSEEQIAFLEAYCRIPGMNKWNRWRAVCRLGVWKNGITRKVAYVLFV